MYRLAGGASPDQFPETSFVAEFLVSIGHGCDFRDVRKRYWKSFSTCSGLTPTAPSMATIHMHTKSLAVTILMEPTYFVDPRHVGMSISEFALRHTPTSAMITHPQNINWKVSLPARGTPRKGRQMHLHHPLPKPRTCQ